MAGAAMVEEEGGSATGQSSLPEKVEAHVDGGKPEMIDTPVGNHLGETLTDGEWKMSASTEDVGSVETSAKSTEIHDAAKMKRQMARDKADRAVAEANKLLSAAGEAVSRVEPWSLEQDEALQEAVDAHGGRFAEKVNVRQMVASMDWLSVSEMVPGKTKQQCSERWILNHSTGDDDTSEIVPSALLTAASEAAASAAGVGRHYRPTGQRSLQHHRPARRGWCQSRGFQSR